MVREEGMVNLQGCRSKHFYNRRIKVIRTKENLKKIKLLEKGIFEGSFTNSLTFLFCPQNMITVIKLSFSICPYFTFGEKLNSYFFAVLKRLFFQKKWLVFC